MSALTSDRYALSASFAGERLGLFNRTGWVALADTDEESIAMIA